MLSGVIVLIASQLGACARYQQYQPAPLAPNSEVSAYTGRRLDDPALARSLAAHGIASHDSAWDSYQLAFAALYFRADLVEARRALTAARAGEITAGVRPYPGVTATVDRAAKADEGHSTPWSFSLAAGLTFERGGKRSARVARARAATLAAQLRLESIAWQAVESAREEAATAIGAGIDLSDASAETTALRSVLERLRGRYGEGQISRVDLARSETDVQTAAVAATQAALARTGARAALAHALAVPLSQVEQLRLRRDARNGCAVIDSLPIDSLETVALRTQPIVGAALADYEVAEGDLRIQIAQQYPDIVVGPGIAWEQGVRRWILSLALPGIATDRARGPIVEATARRAVQAVRVRVVQDSILAAVDSSVAACQHTRHEVAVADSLVRASNEQFAVTRGAYHRGEIGLTEIALTQLAQVRAQRVQHQALQHGFAAGISLENSVGVWFSDPQIDWRDIAVPADDSVHLDNKTPGTVRDE